MTQATATETRDAIISAAFTCFRTQGLRKTTIVDIARAADVSRSTVYEYFKDKETIVEACAEASSQRFYRNMAKAIDRDGGSTLEGRLVRAAVFVTQARQFVEPELYFDDQQVSLMMTKNAATLLQECADFFAPFFTAAKLTGEVRNDLDVAGGHRVVRSNVVLAVHHTVTENRHAQRRCRRGLRARVRGSRLRRRPGQQAETGRRPELTR